MMATTLVARTAPSSMRAINQTDQAAINKRASQQICDSRPNPVEPKGAPVSLWSISGRPNSVKADRSASMTASCRVLGSAMTRSTFLEYASRSVSG
jgi:hypothetical protein